MARAGTPNWLTPESLLATMDKHDIAEALVHHVEARLNYPRRDGNLRLLETIRGLPRLHPVWVLEPPLEKGDIQLSAAKSRMSPFPSAREMVEEMLAAGVRAARLMMGVAPPLHWLWRPLCEALEAHRVPCFLDFAPTTWHPAHASTQANPSDWAIDQLRTICLAHPELPMVLSNVQGGLGIAYPILPLMRRVPNLHIDITAVMDWWRKAAAELGPERVLFATGMPFCDPATFVSNVQYAHEIGDAAKQAICGGNLSRLLEAVR